MVISYNAGLKGWVHVFCLQRILLPTPCHLGKERGERVGRDGIQSWMATITSAKDRGGWRALLNSFKCRPGHEEDIAKTQPFPGTMLNSKSHSYKG